MTPTERSQQLLGKAIYSVKAGDRGSKVRVQVKTVAQELILAGAKALLLACTEIPLVLRPKDIDVPVLDTLEVLALAAVREARATSA